jgi:hypothetical protein
MIKIAWWRNRSISFALIAGIAAALFVYGFLASVTGASVRDKYTPVDKSKSATIIEEKMSNKASTGQASDRVFAALAVDDFDILKTCLKKGARINIIHTNVVERGEERNAETILKDVLVAEVPKSSKASSMKSQGILIDISTADSERLAACSDKGRLKVVISQ